VPVRLAKTGGRVLVTLDLSAASPADRTATRLFALGADPGPEIDELVVPDHWLRYRLGWVVWYMGVEQPFLESSIDNWRLEFMRLLDASRGRDDYRAALRRIMTLVAAKMHVRGHTRSADTYRWALAAMDGWDWRATEPAKTPEPRKTSPWVALSGTALLSALAGALLVLSWPLGLLGAAAALVTIWVLFGRTPPAPSTDPVPKELDESIAVLLTRLGR
jgi:hypothetical protein